MTTPRVTVVIPARNAQSTLALAVGSALAQDGVTREVIVVDDASDDGTLLLARDLTVDPRVEVVHRRENAGPCGARNDGLRRASGDVVLFLDADDQLLPGALTALVGALEDEDTVAAMGRFRAVDERGHELDIGTWAQEQLRPVVRRGGRYVASPEGLSDEAMLTRLVTPPPGAVLVRRVAALGVGGFDVRVRRSEDLDFYVRLTSLGRVVGLEREVLAYQRRSSQRSANERDRRWGRQRALVALVWRAPRRDDATRRARGISAHHWDRARTRWEFGEKTPRDLTAVARSFLLAAAFSLVGLASAARVTRPPR